MAKKKTKGTSKVETPIEPQSVAPVVPMAPPSEADAELCQYVKFEQKIVHRRQLKNAPYNPRYIQEEAREDLKANLQRVGLLEALVWNKRSGNLVGGHQRISILDGLTRHDNYLIPVDVVDLDDKSEKEQCIAFNNPNLQGDFDFTKLGAMFKDKEVEVTNTGFSAAQMYQMFGDNPMVEQPEQLEELAAQMREARERFNLIKGAIKKRDDPDFYQIVFASVADRITWLASIDVKAKDNRFVEGPVLVMRFQALRDRIAELEKQLAARPAAA